MATQPKMLEEAKPDPGEIATEIGSVSTSQSAELPQVEESLGEQLMREAQEGHAEFAAGWRKFMEDLGIQGEPIGAKKLRELMIRDGVNPETCEFSRGIIDMREE